MEEKERYEVKRLDYSLNVKLVDNNEPDWRYVIFDSVNDKELAKLETVCDWLNQKDRRVKELEQQLSKDFTLGEYIRLEQENQQLKQQLLTFGRRISDQNEEILELKQQLAEKDLKIIELEKKLNLKDKGTNV